ncbi:NAD(P)/FAD-dependent oxidoreductase [Algisphaera agarilytica]|uniref:Flavin-dependent dehydrogenase n=1 Tax=Algisphaera agarilytica TaxID=1385975 RepID=A0A7X0HC59_9BACT|nr:FAD-dependent monooxygenase [Algisphaera agarilytica]MBB6431665.1 flavin-dependent dehydrogenase [Algisphaera agarilytica]
MSETCIDAVVIGAGPAGALAARGLALQGHSVWLVDKQSFPRPKVCGCCLNQYAITSLERVGITGLVERLGGRPLERLHMIAGGRSADVPLPRGVSLSRGALDGALIEAAKLAGADFIDGVSAKVQTLGGTAEEGHRVSLGSGNSVVARVLVIADGLGGSSLSAVEGYRVETAPASRIGLGGVTRSPVTQPTIPRGTIAMACGQDGYLGVVELEDGRLDFAAAIDAAAIKQAGGIAQAARRLVEQSGLGDHDWPMDDVERWRATPALTRTRKRIAGPGLFVVGDAAGYVEPFTGEGMAWAIAGGSAVSEVASEAVQKWDTSQEIRWVERHRARIRNRQAGCKLVAATLRRPWLTRVVVRSLSAWPGIANPLVRRIAAPATASDPAPTPYTREGSFA